MLPVISPEARPRGVQEILYGSVLDIEFGLLDRRWLLSVKIGDALAESKVTDFNSAIGHARKTGNRIRLSKFFPACGELTPIRLRSPVPGTGAQRGWASNRAGKLG